MVLLDLKFRDKWRKARGEKGNGIRRIEAWRWDEAPIGWAVVFSAHKEVGGPEVIGWSRPRVDDDTFSHYDVYDDQRWV